MKKRAAVLAAALAAGALLGAFYAATGQGIPCVFYALTGLYCPGCGSGRAVMSLLHGHLYAAFRYNAAMVLLLPFAALYAGAASWGYLKARENPLHRYLSTRSMLWLLAAVALYGALRNIPFPPFSMWAPTPLI